MTMTVAHPGDAVSVGRVTRRVIRTYGGRRYAFSVAGWRALHRLWAAAEAGAVLLDAEEAAPESEYPARLLLALGQDGLVAGEGKRHGIPEVWRVSLGGLLFCRGEVASPHGGARGRSNGAWLATVTGLPPAPLAGPPPPAWHPPPCCGRVRFAVG